MCVCLRILGLPQWLSSKGSAYNAGESGDTDLWTWGGGREKEGEGEMYGESHMETYIIIYEIESQGEFSV